MLGCSLFGVILVALKGSWTQFSRCVPYPWLLVYCSSVVCCQVACRRISWAVSRPCPCIPWTTTWGTWWTKPELCCGTFISPSTTTCSGWHGIPNWTGDIEELSTAEELPVDITRSVELDIDMLICCTIACTVLGRIQRLYTYPYCHYTV